MDYLIFQQINNLAGRWAFIDASVIFFAQYLQYVLSSLALLFFWKKRRVIILALTSAILADGFVEAIKFLWPRPRPFVENNVHLLIEHNGASFPSGHAAFFFALSFIIYQYNKKAGIGFFIASFLISISRVFVGIHWPSDILAGVVVGLLSGWLVLKIFKK